MYLVEFWVIRRAGQRHFLFCWDLDTWVINPPGHPALQESYKYHTVGVQTNFSSLLLPEGSAGESLLIESPSLCFGLSDQSDPSTPKAAQESAAAEAVLEGRVLTSAHGFSGGHHQWHPALPSSSPPLKIRVVFALLYINHMGCVIIPLIAKQQLEFQALPYMPLGCDW